MVYRASNLNIIGLFFVYVRGNTMANRPQPFCSQLQFILNMYEGAKYLELWYLFRFRGLFVGNQLNRLPIGISQETVLTGLNKQTRTTD